ncbi:MAG: hypothetical protein KBB32_07700 [Spirochaetia bacterium]|nr:hypothetical protein [Spirochaetia bacterium]
MKRSQVKNRAVMAAVAAAILLALSAWSCVQPTLPPALSSSKTFLSLSFDADRNPGLDGKSYALRWAGTYWTTSVGLPYDSDLSALKASFIASPGATVKIGSVSQLSGTTANDFSSDVYYTVTAEDGSSMQHRVRVTQEEAPPATGSIGISLRVVSYNAQDFYTNGTNQHTAIAQAVKDMGAHVLILTETESTTSQSGYDIVPFQSALSEIDWAMPHVAFTDIGSTVYDADDIVVLSKYPITGSMEILQPGSWPREGIQATLKVANPDGDYIYVSVIGLHLKASFNIDEDLTNVTQRINQAHALADYLRSLYGTELSTANVVVAGDMNTWLPGDRSPAQTCTLGYLRLLDDADSTNNFHAVNEELLPATETQRLGSVSDHVILSPALWARYVIGSIQVVESTTHVADMFDISDHFPVLLELDL